jgi:putative ABC transport system ATP-binding protein
MRSSEQLIRTTWRASSLTSLRSIVSQPQYLRHLLHSTSPRTTEPPVIAKRLFSHPVQSTHRFPAKYDLHVSTLLPGSQLTSRAFTTSRLAQDLGKTVEKAEVEKALTSKKDVDIIRKDDEDLEPEDEERGFARSEKASQAAQVNLSARLSKEGVAQGQSAGLGEIWRLIKIAKPEAGVLGYAFAFLLISSSISMSIPFSIGRILDIATKADGGNSIFGIELSTFYFALGGVLAVGAAANYGRIIILRIVGERIVARLRSQLFRRTFTQNAEFFDANRVGDLISRLSSDTIIVGKSITQNLSDGLRSLVSGGAGIGLMAFVSVKLTGILALMFPPVALGAFFYGRAIRNLSRRIQKNLGTLTKIAEERLGNVRTSQAFAGEILEVGRYNKQVKKIFDLGKTEALISATFFSAVSSLVHGGSQLLTLLDWING